MTDSELGAKCSDCGAPRPKEPGSCPECGSRNRTIGVGTATETDSAVSVGASKSVSVETAEESDSAHSVGGKKVRVREWVETNWPALLGAAVLTAASFVLGGPFGLVVGVAASTVGVWAFTRIREREIERF